MGFSKEERSARSRAAGLASAEKRRLEKLAREQAAAPPAAAQPAEQGHVQVEHVGTLEDGFEQVPVTPKTPEVERDEPVNEIWPFADVPNPRMRALERQLSAPEPDKPVRKVAAERLVKGTDVGAGLVHFEGDYEPLSVASVHTAYGQIPAPGDRMVRYEGEQHFRLVVKE